MCTNRERFGKSFLECLLPLFGSRFDIGVLKRWEFGGADSQVFLEVVLVKRLDEALQAQLALRCVEDGALCGRALSTLLTHSQCIFNNIIHISRYIV